MPYVTRTEIENEIPAQFLLEALDDDRDGVEDDGRFDALVSQASLEVDSYLAGVFTVPFTGTIPSTVRLAAYLFLGELVYKRRPHAAATNPFKDRADAMRTRLKAIGSGEQSLDYTATPTQSPGVVITEDPAIDDSLR